MTSAGRVAFRLALAAALLWASAPAFNARGQGGGAQSPTPAPSQTGAPTAEQAKAMDEVLGLMQQSIKLRGEKKAAEAVPLMERAVAVSEKAFGDSFQLALSLDILASLLQHELNDLARAEPLFTRSLAVREKVQGADHPDVASTLSSLAAMANTRQDFARAETLYLRALDIYERKLGPENQSVAGVLYALSFTYNNRGQLARAEPLLKRALAIYEKTDGPEGFFTALALNNLASVYEEQGKYDEAEPIFLRSLAIQEKTLGAESQTVATALTNLASLYRQKGDYLKGEPLLKRALAIQEKTLGPEHPDVGITLSQFGLIYSDRGDAERALPLLERALAIYEKTLGPENSAVAAALSSIAHVYNERRDFARAIALYKRALPIVEKSLGAETPLYASTLSNLAVTYADSENYAEAEPLMRRALAIRERVLGPEHPDVAITLNGLAFLYFVRQRFKEEEPLYLRAIEISEKALGPEHPQVGTLLANLATVYWGRGDNPQALQALGRVAELRERNLAILLTVGSEEQKRRYMKTLENETEALLSFHLRTVPADERAAALALTTLLRRKGRVLDVVSDQMGALRRRLDPQDRALLDQLSAARAALARLVLGAAGRGDPAARAAERKRLEDEVQRLEDAVSQRSAEFRTQEQPVTLDAVRGVVPAGAALVEIATFRPFNLKAKVRKDRFGAARYAAYVLRGETKGAALAWVDLGEAAVVDKEIEGWRRALQNPSSPDVRERARAVDELVMRPVRKLLGETRQIFISPDGALNLIPFSALVDESGRYLIENYSLTYLTSGRDLLRLRLRAESRQEPVIVANPAFDMAHGGAPSVGTQQPRDVQDASPQQRGVGGRRSADLAAFNFAPLPGTKGEAAALNSILPGVRVFTEAQASEGVLKQVAGPAVLHVATHGFFLADEKPADTGEEPGGLGQRGLGIGRDSSPPPQGENPLLRSGLALAGANRKQGGAGEDGVLTALEAAGLDLRGTRLVVLSACETGVGEVQNGEGVYGLRRALVLAGSESQVMSLWQVDDAATRDLMVSYYGRLQAGEGRTEALRQVQLEMIRGGGQQSLGRQGRGMGQSSSGQAVSRNHPFFWAAFIQSGDWRGIGK